MARSNLAQARSHASITPDTAAPPRPAAASAASPVRAVPAPAASSSPRGRPVALLIITAWLVAVNVAGMDYYTAATEIRVRHPWHPWLRPSGYVGQSAGILACAIFVFLWLYPFRKRFRQLAFLGSVGRWLDVHVTAALTLPLLLAIHAAWRFDGLIGLGYRAILLVCASGVVGRYLYTRIPRTRSGVELTRDEVAAQRQALMQRLAASTGVDRERLSALLGTERDTGAATGIAPALLAMVSADLFRWRRRRRFRRQLIAIAPPGSTLTRRALHDAVALAGREMALSQQVRMLDATHRVFRWWHVAHRPVALSALVAVVVHVTVVVALGVTWLR